MKKSILLLFSVILASCGGVKKTQQAINEGNYLTAINKSIQNLSKNKTKRGNQEYIRILEDAFAKHSKRELENIAFLKQDGNQANYEKIYTSYVNLKTLQNRIEPLLPLPVYDENREAKFEFSNYDSKLLVAKNNLSEYLYANANELMKNATSKLDFRKAYDDLSYLEEINPGAYPTANIMQEAHLKGIDYVAVELSNQTEQVIPERLQNELLDFNTFRINDFWTAYHTTPLKNQEYDYLLNLDFNQIFISPEQVQEKQISKEKLVKDGFEYVLDDNGNVAKDSLGNDIKVDKFKKVRCDFYQFTQFKTAQLGAKITLTDLKTQQEVNTFPISSEFVFEHIYAKHSGDKRALENDLIELLNLAAIQFPSNEQMVYDAGEDLKTRLATLLQQNQINR
ncbi:hypothetical protein GCM10011414_15450 [Croceivirga lutea]|uniref:hypothetical protein n=1 Tax=Croceivirga lutea TaxID=1775167 RepID=UPI00163991CD|nr:hypothetical protein [Croceivirga lutea]GGG46696.1 hypothetical protein GCM10011414_15450 [Croceivirga lutea]